MNKAQLEALEKATRNSKKQSGRFGVARPKREELPIHVGGFCDWVVLALFFFHSSCGCNRNSNDHSSCVVPDGHINNGP